MTDRPIRSLSSPLAHAPYVCFFNFRSRDQLPLSLFEPNCHVPGEQLIRWEAIWCRRLIRKKNSNIGALGMTMKSLPTY